MYDPSRVRQLRRLQGHPFRIGKLGHVVLNVRDVERSARFYTEMLGFEISDVYPEEMVPGGMVFLRCNPNHHGIALVGSLKEPAANADLNHIAFEVATLDEVMRAHDHLRRHGAVKALAGRRRAGCQIAAEFRDPAFLPPPTPPGSNSAGPPIRGAAAAMPPRRASGRAPAVWPIPSPTRCAA